MTNPANDRSSDSLAGTASYAIIGAGNIGKALAHQFARSDTPVLIASRGGPDSIAALRDELGETIIPASIDDALLADIVIMAVPFAAVPHVAGQVADWKGRILVDATNAIDFSDFSPTDLGGTPSADVIAGAVPSARVVKGFNTLAAKALEAPAAELPGKRVIFLSGNAADAVDDVSRLADRLGFSPINLGRVDQGGLLAQFGGPLVLKNFVQQA